MGKELSYSCIIRDLIGDNPRPAFWAAGNAALLDYYSFTLPGRIAAYTLLDDLRAKGFQRAATRTSCNTRSMSLLVVR